MRPTIEADRVFHQFLINLKAIKFSVSYMHGLETCKTASKRYIRRALQAWRGVSLGGSTHSMNAACYSWQLLTMHD